MFIVGIKGQKQHGKDTIAKRLIEKHGFVMVGDFSEPIRQALCVIFGWTEENFATGAAKETIDPLWGISPRQAMQNLGDDWAKDQLCNTFPEFARTTDRRIWVKRYIQRLVPLYREEQRTGVDVRLVIPGVRFKPEVSLISKMSGEIWDVVDPRKVSTDSHRTETDIIKLPYNLQIMNDSTLEDLHRKVDDVIEARLTRFNMKRPIQPRNLYDII